MKYKLVYIEWEDAVDDTSPAWKTYDEAIDWCKKSTWIVHETGFILKEWKCFKVNPLREKLLNNFFSFLKEFFFKSQTVIC